MNTHIEIKVNGKPIKQYNKDGRTYIEARNGTEYSITVHNDSWQRKLAVITVDGLNVITGQPQGDEIGRGYIVGARSTIDIRGFRKDDNAVGAFKFCNKEKSYCNEQNLKGNNGVIGVRLYDEKARPTWVSLFNGMNNVRLPSNDEPVYYKSSIFDNTSDNSRGLSDDSITCCYSSSVDTGAKGLTKSLRSAKSAPDFSLGTTWGQKLNDSVVTVTFENEETPSDEFVIFYDTRKNLEDIGITFKEEKQVSFPKAFGTYATPPKGWKGK